MRGREEERGGRKEERGGRKEERGGRKEGRGERKEEDKGRGGGGLRRTERELWGLFLTCH